MHCVKSFCIPNFSGPYFHAFGLNMERYSVFLGILSECRKMQSRKTPNMDTFYAATTFLSVKSVYFMPLVFLFQYLLKISEKQYFPDIFSGYRKRSMA